MLKSVFVPFSIEIANRDNNFTTSDAMRRVNEKKSIVKSVFWRNHFNSKSSTSLGRNKVLGNLKSSRNQEMVT